jgi:hypothetical protein
LPPLAASILLAAAEGLRPLKPAVGPNLWLPALIGILALAVLAGVLSRLMRRVAPESPRLAVEAEMPAPPATLRLRLERIRDSGWIEAGAHLKVCDAIAEVMRDFARSRFVVSSPRLTTAELLGEISARGADRAITRPLEEVLEACDLVKFAHASVRAEDLRGHIDTAIVLVDVYSV